LVAAGRRTLIDVIAVNNARAFLHRVATQWSNGYHLAVGGRGRRASGDEPGDYGAGL
jgi:hypothetical protein